MTLDIELLRSVPKVSLHDHLDGGLRPQTVLDLAAEIGHPLPADNAEDLATWFYEAADSGDLVRYLETFDHTIAVMQTADSLRRVAREFVLDLAEDGVVYGEARWAPEQHLRQGLTLDDTVVAVGEGLAEGIAEAAAQGRTIEVRQLVTAMRHVEPTTEIAELLLRNREHRVAGFDIAGAEAGFPPSRFLDSFQLLKQNNVAYTIHAGEAFGVPSIWEAVQLCSASRIGHGVRLIDDVRVEADGTATLGPLASYVRDHRITLEMCPSSNLQTIPEWGIADHPFGKLAPLGFRVTVNCDNRLMSRTTLSREFQLLADTFGYGLDDIHRFTVNAAKGSFLDLDETKALLDDVINPGYAAARQG